MLPESSLRGLALSPGESVSLLLRTAVPKTFRPECPLQPVLLDVRPLAFCVLATTSKLPSNLQALDEVMGFTLRQQADGVAVTQADIDDVRAEGRALAASLDKFLALAPPDDLRLVQKLVEDSR